jgi:hypothetical protein
VTLGRGAFLWAAYAVAFSPVLLDLVQHLALRPWARYAAIFPLLFAVCALCEPRPPARQPGGAALVAAGLASALLAAFVGMLRYARVGAALAAIGLCRRFALASGRSQVLLAFAIPMPDALMRPFHPALAGLLLELAAGACGLAGLTFEVAGADAHFRDRLLSLERSDSGFALMPLLAGLAWYAGCRLQLPVWRSAAIACAAPLLALPVQAAAITAALVCLALFDEALARGVLADAPWIAVTAVGIAAVEWRARRGARA